MDDTTSITRTVLLNTACYPLYLARTLMQLGYEPLSPDERGRLPNMLTYISLIRKQRGYMALYTGISYDVPFHVLRKVTYNTMASVINHKSYRSDCDISEFLAVCLRESALKIHTTLLTYPLVTLGVGYISCVFFGSEETVDYTFQALYKGVVPKLIVEITIMWVTEISKRVFTHTLEDYMTQHIACRVPPFIVSSLLYPLNTVTTVMANNGRNNVSPKFDDWRQCYNYLKMNNQLDRGSSLFWRRHHPSIQGRRFGILERYF